MTLTLNDLTSRTGLTVLDHLEMTVTIPIVDGLQAQGDLIVIPWKWVPGVTERSGFRQPVPAHGLELLRGAAGGNPHSLVADPGTCEWTSYVFDVHRLALGIVHATAPVYLLHPEHGATGLAPGQYVIRRQREFDGRARLVAD